MGVSDETLRPCPICEEPARDPHTPFCSARCRQVDLNRWLSGSYVITQASESDEDSADDTTNGS
ncbi:MAG: DNA gyrase inhibitor YacG [Cohaesibacteraceae bacterium]